MNDSTLQRLLAAVTHDLNNALMSLQLAYGDLEKAPSTEATTKARRRVREARSELINVADAWMRLKDILRTGI